MRMSSRALDKKDMSSIKFLGKGLVDIVDLRLANENRFRPREEEEEESEPTVLFRSFFSDACE